MRAPAKRAWLVVQGIFAVGAVGFAVVELSRQWHGGGETLARLQPEWGLVLGSAALVVAAYVILIFTWRMLLRAWKAELSFGDAARIWFISNLARYIPGAGWQIAALAGLARRRGVSPVAATASSLVVSLANVSAGFAVVLATGASVFRLSNSAGPRIAAIILVVVVAGLVSLPYALPALARLATHVTGRKLELPAISHRALWLAVAGTATAWVLYGIAFATLAHALFPRAVPLTTGALPSFIAAYTSSYLVGYLTLVAPGGVGVRESMLIITLPALGLASTGEAAAIAIGSRLSLTLLEVAPGLAYLAFASIARASTHRNDTAS